MVVKVVGAVQDAKVVETARARAVEAMGEDVEGEEEDVAANRRPRVAADAAAGRPWCFAGARRSARIAACRQKEGTAANRASIPQSPGLCATRGLQWLVLQRAWQI